MIKKYAGLLKFVFAFGIITYLIKKGELDFSLIGKMATDFPTTLILGLAAMLFASLVSSARWRMILHIKSAKDISIFTMFRLTWIGLFFNCFLPGAVTGDLIKLIYAKEVDPTLKKSFLLMSALMDRVMGLMGLVFLLGLSTLINYKELLAMGPGMNKIITINALLFLGILIFLVTIFLPNNIQKNILALVEKVPFIGSHLTHPISDVWAIGESKRTVFYGLIMSMLMQGSNVIALWLMASPFFNTELTLFQAFTFIPIGLIAMAIPIAPAGMGVGHAIFGTLFGYYGIKNGASLFNLYFMGMVTINLMGAIPYLMSSKRPSLDNDSLEEFATE